MTKVQSIEPIVADIVNGAVGYANALLHYTSYTDVISIGVTGYRQQQ